MIASMAVIFDGCGQMGRRQQGFGFFFSPSQACAVGELLIPGWALKLTEEVKIIFVLFFFMSDFELLNSSKGKDSSVYHTSHKHTVT